MFSKQCGPAFLANTNRNFIMSSTSFVITPSLFSSMMPDDMKTSSNLLAFGMVRDPHNMDYHPTRWP